jgi:hypothetical protein
MDSPSWFAPAPATHIFKTIDTKCATTASLAMTVRSRHITLLCGLGQASSSELAGAPFRHTDSSIAGLLLFVAARGSGVCAPV